MLIVIKRIPHVKGKSIQIPLPKAVRPTIAVNNEEINPIKRVVIRLQMMLRKKYIIYEVIKDIHVKAKP